jgi:hypothetical protein
VKAPDPYKPEFGSQVLKAAGLPNIIDIGIDLEPFLPVRPGDRLFAIRRLSDMWEEVGRSGNRFILLTIEVTYTNQNGDIVAKARHRDLAR